MLSQRSMCKQRDVSMGDLCHGFVLTSLHFLSRALDRLLQGQADRKIDCVVCEAMHGLVPGSFTDANSSRLCDPTHFPTAFVYIGSDPRRSSMSSTSISDLPAS